MRNVEEQQSAQVPRIMLAGVSSGCGKTTVTCAILQALVNRGLRLHAFKCGPDYIDPMFHENVIGTKGSNLDPFFYDENTLKNLLAKRANQAEFSVLEGVMGYYDGSLHSTQYSTYDVARITDTPVVLVVDAKGMAFSVTAILKGFLTLVPDSKICGVIFNRVSPASYQVLKTVAEEQFADRVRVLGYLPVLQDCSFESRHLGLVTAAEISDIRQKLQRLAKAAEECIDLNGLLALAEDSKPIQYQPVQIKNYQEPVRIAVAMDAAFCFYYRDNLELLQTMGAELKFFSPLTDPDLPECDALYLGGGYPELYKEKLTQNTALRHNLREAILDGLPCIAECGGFMYLTEKIEGAEMVGVLEGECSNKGRLVRFGYITLTAQEDSMLCKKGEQIRAHEFHHYDASQCGTSFVAEKQSGKSWECVVANETLYAGYPHLPLYANLRFAERFYEAALQRKHSTEKRGE